MSEKPKIVIITPETHWDREWYLPFQTYRAKLVLLIDRLLEILDNNSEYSNFTLDGQVIALLDYLEVRPENKKKITKYIEDGRISIGPMYILPDEYLVSGESLIRNLMLGIKIARKFGKVLDCAYLPDSFGHVAQIPQITAGFEFPTVMFSRGMGNEYQDFDLSMEFNWNAPGNAASIIAVNLVEHYSSAAFLRNLKDEKGLYTHALNFLKEMVDKINEKSCTGIIPLHNGFDHAMPQDFIPDIVKQWNILHPKLPMIQADFGEYSQKLIQNIPKDSLKSFIGELHGGRYQPLLSGTFSTRMWIKQENTKIQNLIEKYSEPFTALSWLLNGEKYPNGNSYLLKAWEELLKNHPHDSICGCSIDEVHDIDVKTRFFNAENMGKEILKESLMQIAINAKSPEENDHAYDVFVFNPLPWERSSKMSINLMQNVESDLTFQEIKSFTLMDNNKRIHRFQIENSNIDNQYTHIKRKFFKLEFYAEDIPAFGYRKYKFCALRNEHQEKMVISDLLVGEDWIENQFYKVFINPNGSFNVLDKLSNLEYKGLGKFEDTGDWGDEYDFSSPPGGQEDLAITSRDVSADIKTKSTLYCVSADITFDLELPNSLTNATKDAFRSARMVKNPLHVDVILNSQEKLIRIKIDYENNSKDHRIRILFPTSLSNETTYADGHFYVVPRSINPPIDDEWEQKWVPTHHQNKFISINESKSSFTIMNKGLPEYEAIKNPDGTITFAITLLRSIEWLSKAPLSSRPMFIGPAIFTPGAQCLGKLTYELAITTEKDNWLNADVYRKSEEYSYPLQAFVPKCIEQSLRMIDTIPLMKIPFWDKIDYEYDSILPDELSFFNVQNAKIILSAFKRSKNKDALIIRLFNISGEIQTDEITFYKDIKGAEIVNLNEETPINEIHAEIEGKGNILKLKVNPHVIVTIKLTFQA